MNTRSGYFDQQCRYQPEPRIFRGHLRWVFWESHQRQFMRCLQWRPLVSPQSAHTARSQYRKYLQPGRAGWPVRIQSLCDEQVCRVWIVWNVAERTGWNKDFSSGRASWCNTVTKNTTVYNKQSSFEFTPDVTSWTRYLFFKSFIRSPSSSPRVPRLRSGVDGFRQGRGHFF